MIEVLEKCDRCPRVCGAKRTLYEGGGYCRAGLLPRLGRAMLHQWEEPCLTGAHGAGAVFFSGCTLRCSYCQNGVLSRGEVGETVTPERLREIFRGLIDAGAACLDLVTASHYIDAVLDALGDELWPVPVVWNCGGYESAAQLKRLEGRVQVYLPDLKYADDALAAALSGAGDYFKIASAAILEMYRQTGPAVYENGLLKRGVLIRHLQLPGQLENTRRVIDFVAESFPKGAVLFSLMSQYTPQPGASGLLARRLRNAEYRAALAYMENCGIENGYTQEKTSAKEEYTPAFDGRGIVNDEFLPTA